MVDLTFKTIEDTLLEIDFRAPSRVDSPHISTWGKPGMGTVAVLAVPPLANQAGIFIWKEEMMTAELFEECPA